MAEPRNGFVRHFVLFGINFYRFVSDLLGFGSELTWFVSHLHRFVRCFQGFGSEF